MKYLHKFNEMNVPRTLTPAFDSSEDLVVSEFKRIIETNHKCDSNLESALRTIFEYGYQKGKVYKMFGSDRTSSKKSHLYDLSKVVDDLINSFNPQRISNNRNLTYNGPEITSNRVLCTDSNVQSTINQMKARQDGPQHFNRTKMEKDFYDQEMEDAYDDEERKWFTDEYNQLEVKIFFYKCYQVAFSEAELITPNAPHGIEEIFNGMKRIKDFRDGKHTGRPHDRRFRTEQDVAKFEMYLDFLKKQAPDWEEFAEYFD